MMVLLAFVAGGAVNFFTISAMIRSKAFPPSLILLDNLPPLING